MGYSTDPIRMFKATKDLGEPRRPDLLRRESRAAWARIARGRMPGGRLAIRPRGGDL